jgi:hypothetical protein
MSSLLGAVRRVGVPLSNSLFQRSRGFSGGAVGVCVGGAPVGGFWVAADAVQSTMLRSTPQHRCFQVIAVFLPNSDLHSHTSTSDDGTERVTTALRSHSLKRLRDSAAGQAVRQRRTSTQGLSDGAKTQHSSVSAYVSFCRKNIPSREHSRGAVTPPAHRWRRCRQSTDYVSRRWTTRPRRRRSFPLVGVSSRTAIWGLEHGAPGCTTNRRCNRC